MCTFTAVRKSHFIYSNCSHVTWGLSKSRWWCCEMWHSAFHGLILTFRKGPAAIITYWAHMAFSFSQKFLSFIGFGHNHSVCCRAWSIYYRSYELKQLKLTSQQKNNMGYDKQKWVCFTYYSPLFRKVTNVLQDSSLQIALKPTNTISHLTKERDNTHSELRS